MDRVQKKPNSSVQHTPSSESFQVYLDILIHSRMSDRIYRCRQLVGDDSPNLLTWFPGITICEKYLLSGPSFVHTVWTDFRVNRKSSILMTAYNFRKKSIQTYVSLEGPGKDCLNLS
jgi:hypothetical protein